jgi:hypothetical protein
MMLEVSRRCIPIWSNTAALPTPIREIFLTPLNWISSAVVSQLPETLVVFPWLIVPVT